MQIYKNGYYEFILSNFSECYYFNLDNNTARYIPGQEIQARNESGGDSIEITISPNTYYSFGVKDTITIESLSEYGVRFGDDPSNQLFKYMFEFESPENSSTVLNLPDYIRNKGQINIEPNCIYQVEILNNLAKITKYPK